MAKIGRPIDLTPQIQEKIVKELLRGNYVETAAAKSGVHKSTLYDWLKRGAREPGSIFEEFSDAVEAAQAESETNDLMSIEVSAHGMPAIVSDSGHVIREEVKRNWQAAAWRLERKHPKKWGRMDRHEHTGKDGGPITFVDFMKQLEEEETEEEGRDPKE